MVERKKDLNMEDKGARHVEQVDSPCPNSVRLRGG
jgi:hypothetical protein